MEWDRYKALCDRPDVMSRWMIEQTMELLTVAGRSDLAAQLDPVQRHALEKPEDHRGGSATDMFELDLDRTTVSQICVLVNAAVAAGVRTAATATRGLGGFVEAWDEFRRWQTRV
jgi:hypothetical protein